MQGFANLTVGVKLAQLLHQATTKITPKIRRKKAGRGPRRKRANPDSAPGITPSRTPGRTSGPGRPPTVEPEADLGKDEELDSLLEHTFNELASDTEASASAAHGRAAASPANSADEDSNNDDNNGDSGAASGDEHMPGMGGFLDIDFAGIASNAEEEFAEALMPVKLPPGAQRALDRDNARKRQRHVAQRGWDAFQVPAGVWLYRYRTLCDTKTIVTWKVRPVRIVLQKAKQWCAVCFGWLTVGNSRIG